MIETASLIPVKEKTNQQRYTDLDQQRSAKMDRARSCAALVLPAILPPAGVNGETVLPLPFSSIASRGSTKLASKIVSVMMPLDDQPVFEFIASSGKIEAPSQRQLLDQLATEVYRSMSKGNLRDVVFRAIQNLVIVGDVLLVMESIDTYRLIRLDQYVVRRDVEGNALEILYLTFVPDTNPGYTGAVESIPTSEPYWKPGFKTVFVRVWKEEMDGTEVWRESKQYRDGTEAAPIGTYIVSPYLPLRWTHVDGEDYGRSMVEELYGDINFLEAATESLTHALAAASSFWMYKRPGSSADNKDTETTPVGGWITASEDDVGCISPAKSLSPQIAAMMETVSMYSRRVSEAFLNATASIPSGDRVTAAAIAMISNELSDGLGGPYITVSRQMFESTVNRTIHILRETQQLDDRFGALLDDGTVSISVVTGLQAMNRNQQLTKLFQLGEMVRNLPPQAQERFAWEEFGRTLTAAMGFNPDHWVFDDQEMNDRMVNDSRIQANAQTEQAAAMAAVNGAAQVGTQAALQQVMPSNEAPA